VIRSPWEWMTSLLECAIGELEQSPAGVPERAFISPDPIVVWDDCCEDGGQVWVRMIEALPVNPLPVADQSLTTCGKSMGALLGLGIVRCAHTIDDNGRPPSVDELMTDAALQADDMTALYRAIVCCEDRRRIVLDRWLPFSGGGCMGGEWTVWVPVHFTPAWETS
jgi:hypothetical protein